MKHFWAKRGRDSPRTSPDQKSVRAILFSCAILARYQHFVQGPTNRFCAWNCETRAENTLPGKFLCSKLSVALDGRDTKKGSGRELRKSNSIRRVAFLREKPQTVPFQMRQGQNKPRSRIGARDLRSRDLHADLHAELHANKNA